MLPPTPTEWLTTSDSWPSAWWRLASRYISRSPRESSFWLVPGWGTQLLPLQARLNDATGIETGPLKVVFALFAQSTWNRQRLSELVPKFRTGLASPGGGGFVPSTSPGSRPP